MMLGTCWTNRHQTKLRHLAMRLHKSNLTILHVKPRRTGLWFNSVNYLINRIDANDGDLIEFIELIGRLSLAEIIPLPVTVSLDSHPITFLLYELLSSCASRRSFVRISSIFIPFFLHHFFSFFNLWQTQLGIFFVRFHHFCRVAAAATRIKILIFFFRVAAAAIRATCELRRKCVCMCVCVCDDDDCFYYHSWRNNVVLAFGTLSSFLT